MSANVMTWKLYLRKQIQKLGVDILRYQPYPGERATEDMALFISNPAPVMIDVGGNLGQTVRGFKSVFPAAVIHSFEPNKEAFRTLQSVAAEYSDVHTWDLAVGDDV